MADDLINGYAEALLTLAGAEGRGEQIGTELSQVAGAIDASEELRATLADASIPVARRQQIVEDLLGGQNRVVGAMVSMVVGAGRSADLSRIADRVIELGAAKKGRVVAEVRSVIPLDADQQERLASALRTSTGKEVEVKVVIDPTIMGGLVTQIDDQIIDGSVRSRIGQLREAF
ncbi:MAG: ATP synthase F1 subunit delta [Actinomycetia bacterium]|nr:ATP synthase F1 subunit delta [Actinomycetes bacterium]